MNDTQLIDKRFTEQLKAISAERYEIWLTKDGRQSVFTIQRERKKVKYFTEIEVIEKIKALKYKNTQGYEISIIPYDRNFYFIALNNLDDSALEQLQKYQHLPCLRLLVNASEHIQHQRQQVVLKIAKTAHARDAEAVNYGASRMAKRYGKDSYIGVQSPLIAAGFKVKGDFVRLERAANRICPALTESTNKFRELLFATDNVLSKAPLRAECRTDEEFEQLQKIYRSKIHGDNVQWKNI